MNRKREIYYFSLEFLLAHGIWYGLVLHKLNSSRILVTQVPSCLHTRPQAVSLPPPTRELLSSPFMFHRYFRRKTQKHLPPIYRRPRDCAKALFPHATDSSHTQKYTHEHTHTQTHTNGNFCRPFLPQPPRRHVCPTAWGLLIALMKLCWLSEASPWRRGCYWGGGSWGPASVIISLYCRLKKPSLYNPTVMRARSTSPPMELPTMSGRGL